MSIASTNQHKNYEEAVTVSSPLPQRASAPNLRQQLIVSLLEFHDKNSSVRSIKQGWKTSDEQRKALERLESFIISQSQFGSDDSELGSYSTAPLSRSDTSSFGWKRSKIAESNNDHPINILCMDGGGMKGYALIAMSEAIETLCGQNDFISRFDLICGASAGGCGSIAFSKTSNTPSALSMGREMLDTVRNNTLESFSYLKLLTSGDSVKKDKQIAPIMKMKYGNEELWSHRNNLNAFALAANDETRKRCSSIKTSSETSPSYSPFLLRGYKLPTPARSSQLSELLPLNGTSSVPMWRAVGSTAAIPSVCDPVQVIDYRNETKSLIDGGSLFNCSLAIAIEEARRMFPNRRFGVIISLGLDKNEDDFAQKAIDIAKIDTPDLHYHRISPREILGDFNSFEKNPMLIEKMEKAVYDYTMNLEGLKETVTKLFEYGGSRRRHYSSPNTNHHHQRQIEIVTHRSIRSKNPSIRKRTVEILKKMKTSLADRKDRRSRRRPLITPHGNRLNQAIDISQGTVSLTDSDSDTNSEISVSESITKLKRRLRKIEAGVEHHPRNKLLY